MVVYDLPPGCPSFSCYLSQSLPWSQKLADKLTQVTKSLRVSLATVRMFDMLTVSRPRFCPSQQPPSSLHHISFA
jgi:hypothetical protein